MRSKAEIQRENARQLAEHTRDKQRYRNKVFIACPRVGLAFLTMNKCGSTTAINWLRVMHNTPIINREEFLENHSDLPIVTHWRDPWRRMESSYRWVRYAKTPIPEFVPPWDQPFADWVLAICSKPLDDWYDLHIASQTYLDSNPLGRPADIRIAWNWAELWRRFEVFGTLPTMNPTDKSTPVEWTPAARAAFERTYSDDLTIWEGLTKE